MIENGDIDSPSGFTGYGDYTDLSTYIYLDSTYTIDLVIYNPSSGGDLGVWIDFNLNGEFEEEENLACEMYNEQESFSFEITVPGDAITGPSRMRIKEKYWEMGCNPCGYTTYGETEDYTVNIVDDTGIDDLDMIRVQIFPNPARDIVNIKSNIKITSINVYNYFGQKLIEKQLSGNEFQLNTSNLTTGIYLFLIETEKQTLSKRLVIGF